MEITAKSEWMEDQMHAVVMSPAKAFEVIQATTGGSIFFSLGTDGVLYATREVQSSATGWNRVDLSSQLAASHNVARVKAKTFCVAQNRDSLAFNLAVVVTVGQTDYLYLSLGNAREGDAWTRSISGALPQIQWLAAPFGGNPGARSVSIEGVYLLTLPTPGSAASEEMCFVDILQGTAATNTMRLLDRYHVSLDSDRKWTKKTLAFDLKAGSISSCLGRPQPHDVAGIYTLGKIEETTQLSFAPAFDPFDPNLPPSPVRLHVPDGTTSIASTLNEKAWSTLFVSADLGIYAFAPDEQEDQSLPKLILPLPLVRRATQLQAETSGNVTAVYGVSVQGELFYATCRAGRELTPAAWSVPVALVSNIQRFAFFLNPKAGDNTVFAHAQGRDLLQLTQDPVTRAWASRSALLPATNVDDIVRFDSFSTRLLVQDSGKERAQGVELLLTATTAVGVYVNNSYRVLNPSIPFRVKTDHAGCVKLSQPTQDSVAVCYRAALASDTTKFLTIDPASKAKRKLATIKSKGDLDNARIKMDDGTTRPLIPADVSQKDREAAAAALRQLAKVASTLPQDGTASKQARTSAKVDPNARELFKITPQEEASGAAAQTVSLKIRAPSSFETFLISAGDLFRSILNTAWDGLKSFALRIYNGIHEVLVQIGDKIYRAVLDCLSAVSQAVEWVFNKTKVFIDDLKRWLGFVFNWKDIVRTHKVLKNVVKTYALGAFSTIGDLTNVVTETVNGLEDRLHAMASLPLPQRNTTVGQLTDKAGADNPTANDPQTHYIHDKAEAHLEEATSSLKSAVDNATADARKALDKLGQLAQREKDTLLTMIRDIKTQIIEPFSSLTIADIIQRLAAIIGAAVLGTAKHLIVTSLELVKDLGTAVMEGLDEPIKIPILSSLYETIADEKMSILDLICLAAAVPATLLYKAVTGQNPFPDNEATRALIAAPDVANVRKLMTADDGATLKKFTIVSEFVAMAGLLFDVVASRCKVPWMTKGEPHSVPDTLKQVSIAVKLLVIMPNYMRPRSATDAWFWKFDSVVTDLAFFKTVLDASKIGEQSAYGKVAPYLDYGISAAWLVPAIAKVAENNPSQSKSSSFTALTANVAYDVAVMTSPIIWNPSLDPKTKLIAFGTANAVLVVASLVKVATGGLLHEGD